MGNMDSARKIIYKSVITLLLGRKLYTCIPKVNQYADQILFELLKKVYIEDVEEKSSLYKISEDDDTEGKRHSRTMQYINYYRKNLAENLKEDFDFTSPKLEIPDMHEHNKRRKGYRLSDYDVEQMKAMEDLMLLKNIPNRRITDVNKITNSELKDEYTEFQKYFKKKFDDIKNDGDFVRCSILLFTTELKYHMMSVYMLADKLSAYQNSRSKNKFSDDYITYMCHFNGMLDFNDGIKLYRKESSIILLKMETIKKLTPDNMTNSTETYISDLKLCTIIKQAVENMPELIDNIKKSTDEERRSFIEERYPIHTILDTELTWKHKKGKYVRDLYASIIKKFPPPKII